MNREAVIAQLRALRPPEWGGTNSFRDLFLATRAAGTGAVERPGTAADEVARLRGINAARLLTLLEQAWLASDQLSGKLLRPILPMLLTALARHGWAPIAPEVRAALKERQRAFRMEPGLVADGRDMGTVIFPDAPFKVFLTASAEERAERRHKQLKDKGVSVNFDDLLREIMARDARDAQRTVAPLKPADDAVVIDTSGIGIDAVVAKVLDLLPVSGA